MKDKYRTRHAHSLSLNFEIKSGFCYEARKMSFEKMILLNWKILNLMPLNDGNQCAKKLIIKLIITNFHVY